MAVQMDRIGDVRLVRESQDNGAATFHGKKRPAEIRRGRGGEPNRRRRVQAVKRCLCPERGSHVDARRQRIGRQRPRIGKRRRPPLVAGVIDEARELGFTPGIVQKNRGGRARRERRVHEHIDPVSRTERDMALVCQERLGRLPVDRHHADGMTIETERHQPRLRRIDETNAQSLVFRRGDGFRWSLLSIEHKDNVTIDLDRRFFVHDQDAVETAFDLAGRRAWCVVPVRPRICRCETALKGAICRNCGLRQAWHAIQGVGCPDPVPMNGGGYRKLVRQPDFHLIALPHAELWARHKALIAPCRAVG